MYSDIAADILAALDKVKTAGGLRATSDFEPRSIGPNPHAYLMLASMDRGHEGTSIQATYLTTVRVLESFTESGSAETAIWPLVNVLCAAIESTPRRHLVLNATADFYPIAGTEFRAFELTVQSKEILYCGEG